MACERRKALTDFLGEPVMRAVRGAEPQVAFEELEQIAVDFWRDHGFATR